MRNHFTTRLISMLLAFVMLVGLLVPASATAANGISFELTDNSAVSDPLRPKRTEDHHNTVVYDDNEVVRVSIVLRQRPTLQAGFSTQSVVENASAMSYRTGLKKEQATVTARIEKALGQKLDVVWNLTLAANLISANVKYGQIKSIENIPGVKRVVLETRYLPMESVTSAEGKPNMMVSANMTGATHVWETGYTGGGTRIAVVDTGLDTDHQSFDPDAFVYALKDNAAAAGMSYEDYLAKQELLDAAEVAEKLSQLHVAERNPELTAEDLYFNEKAPFGYNYLDGDVDITHDNDSQGSHGSHVAGISAANRYLERDGGFVSAADTVAMQGNAPDAQIIVMKVFGKDGGCYESDYMAAIEDAIILECDAINLSLGEQSAGFIAPSSEYQELMSYLVETESVVAIAAGNAGHWSAYSSGAVPNLYIEDVNMQTAGNPSTYPNAFTVASVENDGYVGPSIQVAGKNIGFREGQDGWNDPMTSLDPNGTGTEYEYVFIDGIGVESDYEGIDVTGKVVFVSRGETNFADKAQLAYDKGAVATVIYNNEVQAINMMLTGYWEDAPCVMITMTNGNYVRENSQEQTTETGTVYYTGKLTVKSADSANLDNSPYYTMSGFSSWGVPGDLSLKPEITAPGGNIYSVNGNVPETDQYELMSGTSMATPQISGFVALMKQAIEARGISQPGMTDRALIQSLLMSTALPLKNVEGKYYSLMHQGAGMVDIVAAVSANSYILVDGMDDGKVKVELGDDPSRTGVYTFSFTINNLENADREYVLSAEMFTQDAFMYYANQAAAEKGDENDLAVYMDTATTALDVVAEFSTGNTVTVPAGGKVEVAVTLTLTEEQKVYLDEVYVNGAYVQAYVYADGVTDAEGVDGTCHSIPVLGFYGNWSDPSMYEKGSVQTHATGEEKCDPYTGNTETNSLSVEYAVDPGYHYYLGGNPVVPDSVYHPERNAFNNRNGDKIYDLEINTIRNAINSRMTAVNTATGEVLRQYESGKIKAPYYGVVMFLEMWMEGYHQYRLQWGPKNVEEGQTIEFRVETALEYYLKEDGTVDWDALGEGAKLTIPLTMDSTAPAISNVVVDLETNTLTVEASDNQYVAAVALFNGSGKQLLASTGSKEEAVPTETYTYELDLRKTNGSKFLIQVYDYAYNITTYELRMDIGNVPPLPDMIAFDKEYDYYWTAFGLNSGRYDLSIYCETEGVVFNAATIYDHYVYACDTKGDLYVMPEGDLSDMVRVCNMGVVFQDMAYNPADGQIYGVVVDANGVSALYTVDKLTGAITAAGTVGLNTNTLACDTNGTFYCNEFGTSKVYSFTMQTLDQPVYMLEVTNEYEETYATMGTQAMEYNSETGNVVWLGYYFEEKSWGAYDYCYLYEINPATNTYTRHNELGHQLVALVVPVEGRSGEWANPTDDILSFELSAESMRLLRGYSARLEVSMLPWNVSNRNIVWSSADPTIVDVNQYGMITGLKLGTTTVTATSVLDPSVSDTITVTVETLPVNMEGFLLTDEGAPVQFRWNMQQADTWTATMPLENVLLGATKTANGDLLGLDTDARTVLRVDMTTGSATELGTWETQIYDMAYSKLFSDGSTDRVHMISGSYWIPAKDPANPADGEAWDLFDYIFDKSYAFEFAAIAVGDIVTVEDAGNTYEAEELFLLDDNGHVWKLQAYFDGEFYNSTEPVCYTSNLEEIGYEFTRLNETVLPLSSMVMGDDGKLYLSAYAGSTNVFYQLTMDDETQTCTAIEFATSGDEVWPAILLEVTGVPVCKHTNTEVRNVIEGSCTVEGYTGDTYCLDCGALVAAGQIIPAGHKEDAFLLKAPTTASAGQLQILCSRCGEQQTVVLPALNETDYTYQVILAPTDTVDGTGRYTWKDTKHGVFSFDVVIPSDATIHGELSDAIKDAQASAAAGDAALQGSINTLRNELNMARANLQAAMNSQGAALEGKIAELSAALEAAVAALEAADETNKTEQATAIEDAKSELAAAIEAAGVTLNAAVETVAANLAKAQQDLNAAILSGDQELAEQITALTQALNDAITASETADADLTAQMESAVATLNAAIAQVQKNLDEAVDTQRTVNTQLRQTITIAIVIACVAMVGCLVMVVLFVVDKRKKA